MNLASELYRRRAPEVRRDESLEHALRASSVLTTGRRADGRQADRPRTVHRVAADRAERGKASVASVRGDADAVHPGPARDSDAPAIRASCPQDREGVVPNDDVGAPPTPLCLRPVGALLVWEVETCDEENGEVRRRADPGGELVDHVGAGLDADVVRMAERAAREAEDGAVLPDESGIGLRAAAVDGEDGLQWTASETSRSSRPSRSSAWPIRGCASSAFRASTGSRLSAALTVSRS
jgi:hypothetical protein